MDLESCNYLLISMSSARPDSLRAFLITLQLRNLCFFQKCCQLVEIWWGKQLAQQWELLFLEENCSHLLQLVWERNIVT